MEAGRETVLMQATLKVYRHDPDAGGKPTFQPYPLELPEDATVLDGLVKIREELDGTLAFRASCNRGFCGECTLRINRGGRLACMTRVASARTKERSEEHTSELQSPCNLVCRLLLEKKKQKRSGHSLAPIPSQAPSLPVVLPCH